MYLDFFGLTEAPFRSTGDPRRVFPSAPYESARAELERAIVARRGMLCLLGESSTGKTLLLRQLIAAPLPHTRPVMLLHPLFEFDEVVDHLALRLGTLGRGIARERQLDAVMAALEREAERGGSVVLIVDEAQALPVATLTALPRLVATPGTAAQVLLAGQPALEEQLARAGVAAAIAVRVQLGPMSASDVAGYVRFRLERAGALRREIFTPDAVVTIAQVTRGVPRLVDAIADASLLEAFAAGLHRVTADHVTAAWQAHVQFGPTRAPDMPSEPGDVAVARRPHTRRTALPLPPPTRTTVTGSRTARPVVLAAATAALVLAVSLGLRQWRTGTPEPAPAAIATPEETPVARLEETPRMAVFAPAPRPPEPPPTAAEAIAVVDQFRRAYEAREGVRLAALLAADVVEGTHAGSHDVAALHARLLEGFTEVVYLLPTARIEPRGSAMHVHAPFTIRYRDRAGNVGELNGTALWQIARRDGTPRIIALEHTATRDFVSGREGQ